jgi:hypothetical protein
MMEKKIAFFLWENVCSSCFGSGTYLGERCHCQGGFNAGFRWYIVEIPEDMAVNTPLEDFPGIELDELIELCGGVNQKAAMKEAYDQAFKAEANVVVIFKHCYGNSTVTKRRIRPRFISQKAKAEREVAESKRRCERIKSVREMNLNIAQALWSLNRHAKRIRDGKARNSTLGIDMIYGAKDQALHYMEKEGTISFIGFHKFEHGNFAELLTDGVYSFHRPCAPPDNAECRTIGEKIESKAKDDSELQPDLAWEVIEAYLEGRAKVDVYHWKGASDTWEYENW